MRNKSTVTGNSWKIILSWKNMNPVGPDANDPTMSTLIHRERINFKNHFCFLMAKNNDKITCWNTLMEKAELKLLMFLIQKTFMAINSIFKIQEWLLPSQVSQAHVTSVLCKLTFSQESWCRATSNRWDFVWEIKYWGLRMLNRIIFLTLIFFYTKNLGDLPLLYSCNFWCEFIELVGFFGCYCLTPVTLFMIIRSIMTKVKK